MDLNLTADEKLFRDELRSWLAANAPKDCPAWQNKPLEESYPYLRAWQHKLYEAGWAAVSWPKEFGGRSASLMQQSIFWEEMARADGQFTRPRPDRPDDHRLWYGSAEETLRAENSERRRNLVPGIFGTQRGFRSREFANGCSSRWRSLHRQRPKSLDQLRLDRRLV